MNTDAKKSLGQHFLTSEAAVAKMVSSAQCTTPDVVLEIGPGKGVLTKALLDTGARVVAVELDDDLIADLCERFDDELKEGRLVIVHEDILKLSDEQLRDVVGNSYKVVANIPYYITNAIIEKFLSSSHQPTAMSLLIQKEVAERIVARNGKHSILSVSVQAYATPKIISKVVAGSFNPPPKVDSAILSLTNISKKYFSEAAITEKDFFKAVKAGFAHKRKMLLGNLKSLGIPNEKIVPAFTSQNLPQTIRAEDVHLSQWKGLVKSLE